MNRITQEIVLALQERGDETSLQAAGTIVALSAKTGVGVCFTDEKTKQRVEVWSRNEASIQYLLSGDPEILAAVGASFTTKAQIDSPPVRVKDVGPTSVCATTAARLNALPIGGSFVCDGTARPFLTGFIQTVGRPDIELIEPWQLRYLELDNSPGIDVDPSATLTPEQQVEFTRLWVKVQT